MTDERADFQQQQDDERRMWEEALEAQRQRQRPGCTALCHGGMYLAQLCQACRNRAWIAGADASARDRDKGPQGLPDHCASGGTLYTRNASGYMQATEHKENT